MGGGLPHLLYGDGVGRGCLHSREGGISSVSYTSIIVLVKAHSSTPSPLGRSAGGMRALPRVKDAMGRGPPPPHQDQGMFGGTLSSGRG